MNLNEKEQMKREKKEQIILAMIIIGIALFGVIYMINVYNTDWNDYWFKRFEGDQCEKICEEEGLTLSMQSPSFCGCKVDNEITLQKRRSQNFRDTLQIFFGSN